MDALVELYPRLVVGFQFVLWAYRPRLIVVLLARARLLLAFRARLLLLLLQLKLLGEGVFLCPVELMNQLLVILDDAGNS